MVGEWTGHVRENKVELKKEFQKKKKKKKKGNPQESNRITHHARPRQKGKITQRTQGTFNVGTSKLLGVLSTIRWKPLQHGLVTGLDRRDEDAASVRPLWTDRQLPSRQRTTRPYLLDIIKVTEMIYNLKNFKKVR